MNIDKLKKGGSRAKRKAEDAFSTDSEHDFDHVLPSDDSEDDHDEDTSRVVNVPLRTNPIFGFQIMMSTQAAINSHKNEAVLNTKLSSLEFQKQFSADWKASKPLVTETHEIITDPFKVCILHNVLKDDSILHDIRQEYYELEWNRRKLDLHDFRQSVDVEHINKENIKALYDFLKNIMMPWVAKTMELNLKKISATCSFYADTDYLLVHDDQREDRVVAFVFYFSDVVKWNHCWGGALQLLSCTDKYQPDKPKRDINPENNQLILFPVTSTSYHQVKEITQKNFCRYSLNGWFHGTVNRSAEVCPVYEPPEKGIYSNNYLSFQKIPVVLPEWISEDYLSQCHIEDIQEHIEDCSEISLPNFFKKSKYSELCSALCQQTLSWELVGPPNRFQYEVLPESQYPECIKNLVDLFKSEAMFMLMKAYTDLNLDVEEAGVKYELQRWGSGHYSLLSDYNWSKHKELDVIAYFMSENIIGGQTQYVSEDEEIQQALMTLLPQSNSLNMVFRDTARFTNYISKYTSKPFFVLFCSYVENKD